MKKQCGKSVRYNKFTRNQVKLSKHEKENVKATKKRIIACEQAKNGQEYAIFISAKGDLSLKPNEMQEEPKEFVKR